MPGEGPPRAGAAGEDGRDGFGSLRNAARAPTRLALRWGMVLVVLAPSVAAAQQGRSGYPVFTLGAFEVMQFAMFAGVMGAALLSAIWLIRERGRTAQENLALRGRVAELNGMLQRSEALLDLKDQRIVVWTGERSKPELVGALSPATGVPGERGAFLAFGRWLMPRSAAGIEHAVAALRERGQDFELVVETHEGVLLEAQGRRSAAGAILRFTSLTSAQRAHAELKLAHRKQSDEHRTVLALMEQLDLPFWLRRADGRLEWVNRAYASAVEAPAPDAAIEEGREFLATQAREAVAASHAAGRPFAQTVSTVIGGDRRMFAVTDVALPGAGSAGIARDMSEIDAIRAEHERTLKSHAATLDQLTTAVANFDAGQKLRFFNQAFQKLWDLDTAFLESAPDNALLLDRLRSDGKIAEQPEWRRWKETLLEAYRSVEPAENWWHLPDGRTIRVLANPQPRGGVTWVFENLTEKIDLESRYNTAVRVQGETLDNLAEGVAVFGSDGRIRLSNPAFATLWGLAPELSRQGTHIAAVKAACDGATRESPWAGFVASVTGFDDERRDRRGQVELANGTILRFALINLPNGQVMMTFVDVTDSVNVERALKDKNEALQKADQLKNDFVQHVSYELRSPLTNIIGFTELLAMPETGALNPRQLDYVDHIGSSSSVLLTIVNDILDLATVDAGIMRLDIAEVEIGRMVEAAAALVSERLKDHSIALEIDVGQAPRSFFADENRIRQILTHLLSNAANYSPDEGTILLACRATRDGVEFAVHDDGPGMPPEVLDTVFRRFEPQANGGRRRGAGLGLAIVKSFVDLHGGTVEIDTGTGRGTTVTCRFPMLPAGVREAAE